MHFTSPLQGIAASVILPNVFAVSGVRAWIISESVLFFTQQRQALGEHVLLFPTTQYLSGSNVPDPTCFFPR